MTTPPGSGIIVFIGQGMDCCLQARNSVPQNLNDLSGALQEEWDAMPQQTISRLVDSMRRHYTDIVFCGIPTTVSSFCFNNKDEEITIVCFYSNALLS
uniref:Uncharacterized protein n=1 Tax=Amphiprion ocellaris TaxID=80972 RepID=A0AAQ5XIA5_AMPOC